MVITSYLLTSTVATTLYGKLADLYGAKPVYLFAIASFILGSALVGLSQDMTQMVIFRAAQGIGAGGLVVMAFTIAGTVVPPRDVGRVQGLVGLMYAVASLVGPLVGGRRNGAPANRSCRSTCSATAKSAMTMLVTFVVGMGTIGAYYFLPIYLQIVRGYGPTTAGLQLLPLMIAVMVGAGVSGWRVSRGSWN